MPGSYVSFHKQLGDLVLLEPALSLVREAHGSPVRILTRKGHADLVGLIPGAVFARGLPLAPAAEGYCFDPLSKSATRLRFSPARRLTLIVPERRELRWFHRFLFPRQHVTEIGDRYVAEYFWSTTPLPRSGRFRPPTLSRPPDEWAPPGLAARSFVLVNATSGWRVKMWTSTGWAELLREVEHHGPFVMTNAGQDWQLAHCEEIRGKSGGLVKTIPTNLKQFLWICANARAVLTVDGAASHLAAAFGVPCLTIFGPTNLNQWHYPAAGQVAVRAPADHDGVRRLRRLGSAAVIEAAQGVLRPR